MPFEVGYWDNGALCGAPSDSSRVAELGPLQTVCPLPWLDAIGWTADSTCQNIALRRLLMVDRPVSARHDAGRS